MISIRRTAIVLLAVLVSAAGAQGFLSSQASLWASWPDAALFEKIENDRLAADQRFEKAEAAVDALLNGSSYKRKGALAE